MNASNIPVCTHFQRGYCAFGNQCRYLHSKFSSYNTPPPNYYYHQENRYCRTINNDNYNNNYTHNNNYYNESSSTEPIISSTDKNKVYSSVDNTTTDCGIYSKSTIPLTAERKKNV
eukprot:803912_1